MASCSNEDDISSKPLYEVDIARTQDMFGFNEDFYNLMNNVGQLDTFRNAFLSAHKVNVKVEDLNASDYDIMLIFKSNENDDYDKTKVQLWLNENTSKAYFRFYKKEDFYEISPSAADELKTIIIGDTSKNIFK